MKGIGIQFKKLRLATFWRGGLATFGGPLLSGFTSGHKELTLLSGGRYYRNFTITRSLNPKSPGP